MSESCSAGLRLGKTREICAINEKELNKVELAYFKRPLNVVILSDKYDYSFNVCRDANRLMKGQDVPHLHGDKKILKDFNVLVNESANAPENTNDAGSG